MCVLSGVCYWCVVSPLPIQLRPDEIAQFTCLSLSPGVGVHVTASPLPQSPELFMTTLFSILTPPQNGLPAWSSTCCGFTATPGSHLPPVVLNGILLILSIIMTWMKSLGTWESLDLHLGFIFNLEEKTLLSYVIIRSEEQTHSPGDSK